MEFSALTGLRLQSLRLLSVGTHPAWADDTSPQIATYAANLEFSEPDSCVQVRPCEVPIPNKFPALAIELTDWPESPGAQRWNEEEYAVATPIELEHLLPAAIEEVRQWDSIGDGRASAVDLVLSTGVTVTLRHVFPPMMLGVDVHEGRCHEL